MVIKRDHNQGFGFIIGSEKPTIIRSVTCDGPSDGLLQRDDLILEINGESVTEASRSEVIELISKSIELTLTVSQPYISNVSILFHSVFVFLFIIILLFYYYTITKQTIRKSALLTKAKKERLKEKPTRVRFASGVKVNGSPLYPSMASPEPDFLNSDSIDSSTNNVTDSASGDTVASPLQSTDTTVCSEITIPFIPNVLKVFLENGQTKTFKYDSVTTVQVSDNIFIYLFHYLMFIFSLFVCLFIYLDGFEFSF